VCVSFLQSLHLYNAQAKQAVSWQSEVLTVWRRLHIERDAMQAPPNRILPRPCLPDLSWLQDNDNPKQNLLVWAYVRPTNDGGGGKTDERDFPFDLNTSDEEATDPNYYAPRHQSIGANDEDYWVVYLLSIFQGPLLEDFDPNQQLGTLGWCVLPGNPCGNLSIFYVEQYRDPGGCRGLNPQAGVRSGLQATVVHEIGHSFGGIHSDGGIMASGTQACLKNSLQFTDITLNRIRSTSKPGGRR